MLGHLYNNSYTRCISSLALTSKLLTPITNFYYSFMPLSAGFIIGLILSGIVMGLLSSAVFAELGRHAEGSQAEGD